jgi:hypothetical protein
MHRNKPDNKEESEEEKKGQWTQEGGASSSGRTGENVNTTEGAKREQGVVRYTI